MLRHCLLVVGLLAATTLPAGGCRSCSSCHDYDSPVANCQCNACGTCRAGSACCDTVEGESTPETFESEDGEVYEEGAVEGALPEPQAYQDSHMGQPYGVR